MPYWRRIENEFDDAFKVNKIMIISMMEASLCGERQHARSLETSDPLE